jgi:hypothetical protein
VEDPTSLRQIKKRYGSSKKEKKKKKRYGPSQIPSPKITASTILSPSKTATHACVIHLPWSLDLLPPEIMHQFFHSPLQILGASDGIVRLKSAPEINGGRRLQARQGTGEILTETCNTSS